MEKYTVEVREVHYHKIKVEAESRGEAEELAIKRLTEEQPASYKVEHEADVEWRSEG